MPQLKLPPTTTRHQYVLLGGGLDLLTPTLQLKPGYVRDALNFEQSINGGYTRIDGYERFDGMPAPSAALYFTVTVQQLAPISVGGVLTGQTSGATGVVLSVDNSSGTTVVAFTKATGMFVDGEHLLIGATQVANDIQSGGSGIADDYDATQKGLAANVYRAFITRPPGSGPCRGGFFYNGIVYSFRDNAGATALTMWKSSATGWQAVTIPAMLAGGRVQTDRGNFDGTVRIYGCDGVNKGWVFDGTTLALITTGNAPDVPGNVMVHKDALWFSFGSNVQVSGPATPLVWSAGGGSVAFRFDANVTSMQRQPGSQAGGAASISTETSTSVVYGNTGLDFQVVSFEQSAGSRQYGGQRLGGQTILFGNIGVFSLSATQAFGNFQPSAMTMKIRPFTQTRRNQCVGSLVNKEKSQYRVFFADGYALYMTILNGKLVGSMPIYFPTPLTACWQGDSPDGTETSYFGDANGWVYRLDSGTSCDGAEIQAFATLAFNNEGAVRTLKHFRRATIEIQGETFARFGLTYEVNYGAGDRPQGDVSIPSTISLASSYWDAPGRTWDNFTWDGKTLAPTTIELRGTGENIALRVDCSSALYAGFTLNSVVLDYTVRRIMRNNQ